MTIEKFQELKDLYEVIREVEKASDWFKYAERTIDYHSSDCRVIVDTGDRKLTIPKCVNKTAILNFIKEQVETRLSELKSEFEKN